MKTTYIGEVGKIRITPDLECTEGYSVVPGIDIRYPEESVPVEFFRVTVDDSGYATVTLKTGRDIVVMTAHIEATFQSEVNDGKKEV